MSSDILHLRNLIQGFILSCKTEGKSGKTIEWYDSFLRRFLRFLEENKLPAYIDEIDKNRIRAFILYLQQEARTPYTGRSLSPFTVQGYVRTLKAFFSWAKREDYTKQNPMNKIAVPKAPVKLINTFSNDQITTLFNLCASSNTQGYRNLTIILLLLDSGIRVSELVGIDLDDVNLNEGHIRIRMAKGNKERVVPIGSLVQKSLWKYINCYRPRPITEIITRLFLSVEGAPLTKSGIQQMLRRYGQQAGFTEMRCSPHVFRHTFARNYLMNGGDIFSLQKILGHSSLASVRMYLNLFASDIKKQHQRFSPVDNLATNRSIYPFLRSRMRENRNHGLFMY